MIIRPARVADLDALSALNDIVQSQHAAAEPSYFETNVDEQKVICLCSDVLGQDTTHVFVAEKDSILVGCIWFELQDRQSAPFTKPPGALTFITWWSSEKCVDRA